MTIEAVEVPTIKRERGGRLRLWYAQPRIAFHPGGPPWRCQYPEGLATGQAILDAIVLAENSFDQSPNPTFILLPECSIPFAEVDRARQAVARLRPNSVVVFGIEQMTADEALSLENHHSLWEGADEGRFTNCAAIGIGGTEELFLQPKILPSQWEAERFWPGRKVRYFAGGGFSWIVQVCSDLLDRPEGATTATQVADWLYETNHNLSLVIWVQHNPKPRSPDFQSSIGTYCAQGATILAVASTSSEPGRLENHAVSGALIQNDTLPTHFHLLAKEFHYIEPLTETNSVSRIVLLRYDSDAHRATTVLSDSVNSEGGPEKGEVFSESQPYILDEGVLQPSPEHSHLEQISSRAMNYARQGPAAVQPEVLNVAQSLWSLSTKDFLAFLDLALLPRPGVGVIPHAAGERHEPNDLLCRCWDHRECIDYLCTDRGDESAFGVANVLTALGALRSQGVGVAPATGVGNRTCFEVYVEGTRRLLAVVWPFGVDAGQVAARFQTRPLVDIGHIVLGTGGRARPLLADVNAARARPSGSVEAGTAQRPMPRIVFQEPFEESRVAGQLRELVEQIYQDSV